MSTNRKVNLALLMAATVLLAVLAGSPALAGGKPQPPAPKPEYRVLDLGAVGFDRTMTQSVMNDQGQVVCHGGPQMVVLTPSDSNAVGFWDGASELTILMPDRAWFANALGLTQDQEVEYLGFGPASIGQGGVLSGTITGNVYPASGGESLYGFYRAFVVKTIDVDGDGINDEPLTDLGLGMPDPDGANIGVTPSTWVTDMNQSGCIVVEVAMNSHPGQTRQAFRIVPIDADGDGVGDIWFEDLDGDGLNDLMEPLLELGSYASALDDAGRAYLGGTVVLPDGTSSMTGSSLDRIYINAGNRGGLAVGRYYTGKTVRAYGRTIDRTAPFLIQGLDTDADGNPDLWFRDANGDGKNDLMVKLGMLSGYTDLGDARAVNDSGTIVGVGINAGAIAGVHRALIWKNQVAVDLNTLVSPSGVVLEDAISITQAGVILCIGTDAAGAGHGYLLMPSAQAGAAAKQAAAPESGVDPCPSDEEPDTDF